MLAPTLSSQLRFVFQQFLNSTMYVCPELRILAHYPHTEEHFMYQKWWVHLFVISVCFLFLAGVYLRPDSRATNMRRDRLTRFTFVRSFVRWFVMPSFRDIFIFRSNLLFVDVTRVFPNRNDIMSRGQPDRYGIYFFSLGKILLQLHEESTDIDDMYISSREPGRRASLMNRMYQR